jgi:hypothetical protein
MSEHLGYDKYHPAGRNHGNPRNGIRSKTVLTEIVRSRSTFRVMWTRRSNPRSSANDNA